MNAQYPKGSEWRKWDLQLHCPADVLQNQFEGKDSTEKWDRYLSSIEKTDLEVIGITNYFCINGYEELLAYKKRGRVPGVRLILPNIEFRISQPNKEGEFINLHVIFSDKIKLEKIKEFLARLPLLNTTSDGKLQFCSEEGLRAVEYERALIEPNVLKELIEKNFEPLRDYLIFGVPRGYGSFRPEGGEGRGITIAIEIDKIAHAFFGRADDTAHFFDTQRYENAVAKPVVATSDAHQLEMVGANFSWIKADPTFEGLKQIVFEPQERIKIQGEKPEGKKTYFFIDKARFIDNSTAPNFPSDFIELNQNITAVIGGRSTGKSLLMHYIAKTIDKEEVAERLGSGSKYNFDENPNFNFEVVWGDSKTMQLKNPNGEIAQEERRKILYIPQNYLNRLSEVDIKSKDTLNRFVIDVLTQDEKVGLNYQNAQEDIKRLNKEIPPALNELFSIKTEMEQLEEELKQLGDPKGIESYIKKLENEALDIKSKSGLSDEEIKTYESLAGNEKTFNTNLSNLNADRETVSNLQRDLLSSAKDFLSVKNEHAGYLNDPHIVEKFKQIFLKFETLESDITNASQTILKEIDEKIKENKSELSKIQKELVPLTSKIKLQAELEKKMTSIKEERKKLDKIALHQKTLKLKSDASSKKRVGSIGLYKSIFAKYDDLRNEFKKYENKFEDIALSIIVGFNEPEFNARVVDEFLNKQTLKKSGDVNWRDEFKYQYDPVNHVEDIIKIFDGILSGKVGILKHRSKLDAITKLLENRFFLDFGITYKDDQLDKMSPGKKGLVLLKLLIELSNDEWPILLDQPDDDLDNRSIYADLVSFLLKKKRDRQIIVVTHNPNLVVGADAEEAIVANQAGQETGRENRMFHFEYVSGALENAFELTEREEKAILFRKGIRQHVCEVLEGGKEAFQKREQKYSFPK